MKKIFLAIFILISIASFAQNDTSKYFNSADYGWRYRRIKANLSLTIPTDTVANKLVGSVVILNDKFYIKKVSGWSEVSGSGGGGSALTLGYGLSGGSFDGSLAVTTKVDTTLVATLDRLTASLLGYATSSSLDAKVNISDTALMLDPYALDSDISGKLNTSDTTLMLNPYARSYNVVHTSGVETINNIKTFVSAPQLSFGFRSLNQNSLNVVNGYTTFLTNHQRFSVQSSDQANPLHPTKQAFFFYDTSGVGSGQYTLPSGNGRIALTSDITTSISGFLAATDTTTMLDGYKTFYPRTAISLTTIGSGAATYDNGTGVLNIPVSGAGGIALTDLSANFPLVYNNSTGNFRADTGRTATALLTGGTGNKIKDSVMSVITAALALKAPLISPSFTTPSLGVATATSINGVTISGSATPTLEVTGTTTVSGSNTGDNAVNTLYSGLAASKLNVTDSVIANRVTADRLFIDTKLSLSDSTIANRVTSDRNFVNASLPLKVNVSDTSTALGGHYYNKTYIDANLATKSPIAGSSSITTVGTIGSGVWQGTSISSNFGGAGTVNGIMKANGSGTVSAATAGTDYLIPTQAISLDVALGTTNPALTLYNSTAAAAGNISQILFRSRNAVGGNDPTASITATNPNAATNNGGQLTFATSLNGASTLPTTRFTINNDGTSKFEQSLQVVGKLYVGNTTNYLDYVAGDLTLSTGSATKLTVTSTGDATFTNSVTAASFIKSGGTGTQYLMADGTTSTGGSSASSLTMDNSGTGAASGTTFNGGTPQTISYNTIGAFPTTGGTLTGSITLPSTGATFFGAASEYISGNSTSHTLEIGTNSAADISIASTGAVTMAAALNVTGATTFGAGTTTTSPAQFTISGAVLETTVDAGDLEADANGIAYYSHETSARGVISATQFISLTGTYTLTSQTAAQKAFNSTTNGALTVKAGTSYFFEGMISLSSMSATSGSFGFALGGTATLTSVHWQSNGVKAATLATAATNQMTFNATAANTTVVTASTATNGHVFVKGIVRVNAAGTLIPSVSLGVAAAAVVGVNSYFKLIPIGTNTVTNVGNWN
jgi:hypothetical protein